MANRVLLLLAIVVPVVACAICLNALKEINHDMYYERLSSLVKDNS